MDRRCWRSIVRPVVSVGPVDRSGGYDAHMVRQRFGQVEIRTRVVGECALRAETIEIGQNARPLCRDRIGPSAIDADKDGILDDAGLHHGTHGQRADRGGLRSQLTKPHDVPPVDVT